MIVGLIYVLLTLEPECKIQTYPLKLRLFHGPNTRGGSALSTQKIDLNVWSLVWKQCECWGRKRNLSSILLVSLAGLRSKSACDRLTRVKQT